MAIQDYDLRALMNEDSNKVSARDLREARGSWEL